MSRSFVTRAIDFMGRSTLGMDNGFVRDKWLQALGVALIVVGVVSQAWPAFALLAGLVAAVFVNDLLRYNREHGHD